MEFVQEEGFTMATTIEAFDGTQEDFVT